VAARSFESMSEPMSEPVRLSIVMPVLNEAAGVRNVLLALQPQLQPSFELIVADGGSADDTIAQVQDWINAFDGRALLVKSPAGRAKQLNAGAAAASGQSLLFLHADTHLPPEGLGLVLQALTNQAATWGRFDVRIAGQSPWLPVVAWFMNQRSRLTGVCTGDQGLFMNRAAWLAVGGFPDQALMEDIELSKRLKRVAAFVPLRAKVTTSGRRWDTRGAWRTIVLMWRLRLAYWLGTDAARLAQLYR
jgi:rSAM/selenodomain-associated transferase 2